MRPSVCIFILVTVMVLLPGVAHGAMIPLSSLRNIETSGFTAYTPPEGPLLTNTWDEFDGTDAFGAFAGTVSGEALTPAGSPTPIYAHGEAGQDSFFGANFYQFRGYASGNYAGTGDDWASGMHALSSVSFEFELTTESAIDLYWAMEGQGEGDIALSAHISLSGQGGVFLFDTTSIGETGPQLFHTILDPGVYLFESFASLDNTPEGQGGDGMSGISVAGKIVASVPTTPEPASALLLLLGLGALAIRRRGAD